MKTRERVVFVVAMGMLLPLVLAATGDVNELALVDSVVAARAAYEKSLRDLISFYSTEGMTQKYFSSSEELKKYQEIPKHDFLQMGSPIRRPAKKLTNYKGADIYYEDGVLYKEYPDLFTKKKKLVKAIDRFKMLLEQYPDSDKADDACYMLGEIYEGFYFKDPYSAAGYYDKATMIDPHTVWPAYYRAAMVYYEQIPSYEKAAERFRLVIQYGLNEKHKEDAVKKLEQMKADGLIK